MVVELMPVPVLVSVTAAPATTAPLVSRTAPSTLAVSNWASAGAAGRPTSDSATTPLARTLLGERRDEGGPKGLRVLSFRKPGRARPRGGARPSRTPPRAPPRASPPP